MLTASPAVLIVAHPGHELRVHGWLELARPRIFVLTDGSGRSGRSRLQSTRHVIAQVGATPGAIFGRFTDRVVYDAMLRRDMAWFIALVDELADCLAQERMGYVVGDAAEGYNPVHDLCRVVIDAAVALIDRGAGRALANFDFPLVGRPDAYGDSRPDGTIRLILDEAAFQRKLQRAFSYPELAEEVRAALDGRRHEIDSLQTAPERSATPDPWRQATSIDAFRVEYLRRINGRTTEAAFRDAPPFYERYGERQVALEYYREVIRYREHLRPLIEAIRHHGEAVS